LTENLGQEKKYTKTGTTSKDRYSNKTDDGRTIISTTGLEDSIIARSSKENWEFWTFIETLKPNEIQFLITSRKTKLKYINDIEEFKQLKSEITLLEDAYRIIKRKYKRRISGENIYSLRPSSIKSYGTNILNNLGFNNNTYYKSEVISMVDKLCDNNLQSIVGSWKGEFDITDELVATSIIKEILDRYKVKYEEETLLAIHDLDDISFYKWHLDFHIWCRNNYWIS